MREKIGIVGGSASAIMQDEHAALGGDAQAAQMRIGGGKWRTGDIDIKMLLQPHVQACLNTLQGLIHQSNRFCEMLSGIRIRLIVNGKAILLADLRIVLSQIAFEHRARPVTAIGACWQFVERVRTDIRARLVRRSVWRGAAGWHPRDAQPLPGEDHSVVAQPIGLPDGFHRDPVTLGDADQGLARLDLMPDTRPVGR